MNRTIGDRVAYAVARFLIAVTGPPVAVYIATREAAKEFRFELRAGFREWWFHWMDREVVRRELSKRKTP